MHTPAARFLRAGLGVCLVLAAILVVAPAAFAVDCRISGTVSDAGTALPGVTVAAYDTQGQVVAEAVTAADGAYAIEPLAPGSYRVGSHPGDSDHSRSYWDGATDLAHATPIALDDAHPAFVADLDVAIRTLPSPAAADDGGPAAAFKLSLQGTSVACSGDTLAVGARLQDYGAARWAGAVYVYRHTTAGWMFEGRLFAPRPTAYSCFGTSVAIGGDHLLIADARYGGTDRFHVFAYARTNDTWRFQRELTPRGDVAARRGLGASMAVSGRTALVGAPAAKIGGELKAGAVYVFTLKQGAWARASRITSPRAGSDDAFGSALTLCGSVALVGAPLDDTAGADSGSAYAFASRDGVWKFRQRLDAGSGSAHAQFGSSVAMDATHAVVAAPRRGRGVVVVFARGGRGWKKQARLGPARATASGFGSSLAIDGETVLVGAPQTGAVFNRSKRPGAVYEYVRSSGAWRRAGLLGLSEMEEQSAVGSAVGILGREFIVLSEWDTRTMDESFYGVRVYDPYVTAAGTPLEASALDGVLMNDFLPDVPSPVTAQLVDGPSHGQLDLREDGSFTYTPDAGYVGTDSFRYDATIPGWWVSRASATVTVR
jgi:hypothetical protein